MNKHPIDLNLDEWIAAALLDELTPEEREAFELHLNENPAARTIYNQNIAMTHLLESTLAGVRPSPNFENRMIHAFREQARNHRIKNFLGSLLEIFRRSLRFPYVYIPATAAILIGLVQLGSEITRPMEKGQPIAESALREPTYSVGSDRSELAAKDIRGRRILDNGLSGSSSFQKETEKGNTVTVSDAGGTLGYLNAGSQDAINRDKDKNAGVVVAKELPMTSFSRVVAAPISLGISGSGGMVTTTAPAPGLQPTADPGIVDNRKLVRNASLDLEVKNYDTALDSIAAIASGNSGYVATKNSTRLPNGKMSGTVIIKVLPDRLDAALLQIRALGDLKNQSLSTRDVTKEYFDTDARLRNSRKMEERLLALLDTMKGKITELLAVEKELARVREEIETMQGELKVYDSLVQYATVTISLREKDLNEAAAYLLKENVTLSLFSSDVEKTYETARHEADDDKAQIVQSRLERNDSGRATAFLTLLIAPENAESLIARVKGLGRVQNFNKEDQRVAQDGSGNSTTAKVERDKVQLNLTILPDDESRKQVALTVITKQVEPAFENAKTAATMQGGDLINSDLQHTTDGGTSATLSVRVPAKNYSILLENFKKAGIVSQFAVQRDENKTGDGEKAPVMINLTLTDADQPVQFTQVSILTPDVETQATHIKQAVASTENQVEVKTSTFERTPDGRQTALLVFRLPLTKYQAFLGEIENLGKVKELTVRRQDRTDAASSELTTAEVTLRLYSQGNVVTEDNGLFSTLRKTLGEGVGALMWSVRMIGVAIAFIAPWALALVLLIWIIRKVGNRKSKREKKSPTD